MSGPASATSTEVLAAATPISNWDDFMAWRNREIGDAVWVYRGQRSIRQPLRTSLERFVMESRGSLSSASEMETFILREFKRRYHHYSTVNPEHAADGEWFSIMQHHGAPTRLLDFTYSIWVAVYFALERAHGANDGEGCSKGRLPGIWCFKKQTMLEEACSVAGGGPRAKKFFEDYTRPGRGTDFRDFLMLTDTVLVAVKNPYFLNQRQSIQRGVFMIPSAVTCPFTECLERMKSSLAGARVVELDLSRDERERWLNELFHMGISNETLFPGLDGFARTLAVYNPVVMKRVRG